MPPGAPTIPGLEAAGTIVAVGEGADESMLGQSVTALLWGGGYAEYCVAPAGQCLPVPPTLSMVEAAALPETLFTVWSNLFERAFAIEGDTVLVHGGTSGIGTMAILLGRLFDLTLIVTCGSDEKCAKALEIGAAHAVNYKTQDFVEEVKRITGGRGVAAVLDMVGGDYLPRNLQCLAEEGRHVSIAVQGGARAEIDIGLMMARRLTLTGSMLRPRSMAFKALVADEIARIVWPHVAEGKLRPIIDRTFPLAQAAEAHRRMEEGDHVGKIVLELG
jgi:putative PIG3 family NAD(P)H quinone oxidoreductase